MCSSMLLVVQSTIVDAEHGAGLGAEPDDDLLRLDAVLGGAPALPSETTAAMTRATTTRPRVLPIDSSPWLLDWLGAVV